MTEEELHVWENGVPVGVFHNDKNGDIGFEYDGNAKAPISLSLPLSGEWEKKAPQAFLENLLPDDLSTRDVMASSLGAKSTSTFDLLDGVDATGGLAFSLRDVSPFPATPVLSPMTDGDIVNRIRDLSRLGSAWWAMPVAGEFFAENVMSQHWEQLAQQNALDPSRVVCIARNMREKVHDGMDEAIAGLDSPIADRLRRTWEKTSQMV
ncbi:HipA N-terminal domain-containing protein [Bifidobacterium subtile]|jgi:HipA-like protein|uniref:Phosphatidylinositol kinase n=1 Tax=Bifidobacterium subtile TaxID=77635 RepID=A0A087E8G7_9BIFI|nr:HipA N-terminal domain-containing protein [Bifidobacterium subtile]KFJ04068.1 phosphatidylinositol kinase [Bifidobacterium subtile]MCI1223506.1 HipA N-terminal domain-containing protein [Bifidobacterium subtile]MCI1240551.1 HipA N-terminal domain-containing protein [Bifidobacterium subtile]MCI1258291.1 HipA N-terminal domain-containing protein [Bifidobacterium subtile]QOL36882.1 HipA N-terminal domain-containing protein [Bifidobacterium subtile]